MAELSGVLLLELLFQIIDRLLLLNAACNCFVATVVARGVKLEEHWSELIVDSAKDDLGSE